MYTHRYRFHHTAKWVEEHREKFVLENNLWDKIKKVEAEAQNGGKNHLIFCLPIF